MTSDRKWHASSAIKQLSNHDDDPTDSSRSFTPPKLLQAPTDPRAVVS